jgi:hypothetical protein
MWRLCSNTFQTLPRSGHITKQAGVVKTLGGCAISVSPGLQLIVSKISRGCSSFLRVNIGSSALK